MTQSHTFRGTARAIVHRGDKFGQAVEYRYHATAIVTAHPDGRIVLDSGGWKTTTTKRAINQVGAQFFGGAFSVYQSKGEWLVEAHETLDINGAILYAGELQPFSDGLTIKRGAL